MEARVRLIVNVPFQADVESSPEIRLNEDGELIDRDLHETTHVRISDQRIAAAKHAETELIDKLRAMLPQGALIEAVVEEVHEVVA